MAEKETEQSPKQPPASRSSRHSKDNSLTPTQRLGIYLGVPAILVAGGLGGYAIHEFKGGDGKQETAITAASVIGTPTTAEAAVDPTTTTAYKAPETTTTVGQTTTTTAAEVTTTTAAQVAEATPTTVFSNEVASNQAEGNKVSVAIPVPSAISGSMAREVRQGGTNPMYKEGEWFNPVYDLTQEGAAANYRGIGPWYPVAFANLDPNAAVLTTHGNVGELVISGRNGGKIMIAVMQLDKHQTDGAWGTNPQTGRFEKNDSWAMQYNFHSLQPNQEILVVDPDTGSNLLWPDGSPVIYRANEQGIAAFAIPKTHGQDVRVGFVFDMPAAGNGVQFPEVKFERGPNDNPGKTGENPLPDSVLKPMVAEK